MELLISGIPGNPISPVSGIQMSHGFTKYEKHRFTRTPVNRKLPVSWIPGNCKLPVSGTPASCFLSVALFFPNFNPLLQTLKQQ